MSISKVLGGSLDVLTWPWKKWMIAVTEVRIRNSLRSDQCQLFGVSGGTPFVGDVVAASTDYVVPVFNVHACEFNRYVASADAEMRFVVDSEGTRHDLGGLTVVLMAQPLNLRQVALKWRGSKCERIRGPAAIRGFIAGRELFTYHFHAVSWEDVARGMSVESLSVNVDLRDGRLIERPGQLGLGQAASMAPEFTVRCPAFCPNWEFPGRFVVHQGSHVIAGAAIKVVPNAGQIRYGMGKVSFPSDLLLSEPVQVRLEIATLVKALHRIRILDAPPITDYEGRLTVKNQNGRNGSADLHALIRGIQEI